MNKYNEHLNLQNTNNYTSVISLLDNFELILGVIRKRLTENTPEKALRSTIVVDVLANELKRKLCVCKLMKDLDL